MLKVAELGLLKADLARGLNLFVGSGFSTLAHNSFAETLPVGEGLKSLLVKEFNLELYAMLFANTWRTCLLSACTIIVTMHCVF